MRCIVSSDVGGGFIGGIEDGNGYLPARVVVPVLQDRNHFAPQGPSDKCTSSKFFCAACSDGLLKDEPANDAGGG